MESVSRRERAERARSVTSTHAVKAAERRLRKAKRNHAALDSFFKHYGFSDLPPTSSMQIAWNKLLTDLAEDAAPTKSTSANMKKKKKKKEMNKKDSKKDSKKQKERVD